MPNKKARAEHLAHIERVRHAIVRAPRPCRNCSLRMVNAVLAAKRAKATKVGKPFEGEIVCCRLPG